MRKMTLRLMTAMCILSCITLQLLSCGAQAPKDFTDSIQTVETGDANGQPKDSAEIPPASAVNLDDFRAGMRTAWCQNESECINIFESQGVCVAETTGFDADGVDKSLAAYDAGLRGYDPANGGKCLAAASSNCAFQHLLYDGTSAIAKVCKAAFPGAIPDGKPCQDPAHCKSGSCAKGMVCSPTPTQTVGGPCPCGHGLVCDKTKQNCRAYIAGDNCDFKDGHGDQIDFDCGTGLSCVGQKVANGDSIPWLCTSVSAAGEVCSWPKQCPTGLTCALFHVEAGKPPQGTCTNAKPGAPCLGNQYCEPNMYCSDESSTCKMRAATGENCKQDGECSADLKCVGSKVSTPGKCKVPELGDSCEPWTKNWCGMNRVCTAEKGPPYCQPAPAKKKQGDGCTFHSDECEVPLFCVGAPATCESVMQKLGAPCKSDEQCPHADGRCVAGICKSRPSVGESCSSDVVCRAPAMCDAASSKCAPAGGEGQPCLGYMCKIGLKCNDKKCSK